MTMANRVPFYFFSFASPCHPPLRMTDPTSHLHTNVQPDALFSSMVYNCPTRCIILQMVPNIIPASNVFFSLLTFWSEKKEVPFWSLKLVWRSVFGNNAKKVFARNGFTPKPKPKSFSGLFKRKKKKRQDKHLLSLRGPDDYGKQGSLFIFFSLVWDFKKKKKNGVGFNSFSKGFWRDLGLISFATQALIISILLARPPIWFDQVVPVCVESSSLFFWIKFDQLSNSVHSKNVQRENTNPIFFFLLACKRLPKLKGLNESLFPQLLLDFITWTDKLQTHKEKQPTQSFFLLACKSLPKLKGWNNFCFPNYYWIYNLDKL